MTKRLIKNALLELLEQKELAAISVTALCERADVHRSTFYKYYANPSDLLAETEQDFLDRIPFPQEVLNRQTEGKYLDAAAEFLDFVKENARAYRIFFGGTGNGSFTAKMTETLCYGYIPDTRCTEEPADRMVRLYVASGIIGMLREWINTGFPIGSRPLAEMMYTLSRKVLS